THLAGLPVRHRGGGGHPVPVRGLGLSLAELQRLCRRHRRPSDRTGPPDAGLSDCRGPGLAAGLGARKTTVVSVTYISNKPQYLFAGGAWGLERLIGVKIQLGTSLCFFAAGCRKMDR